MYDAIILAGGENSTMSHLSPAPYEAMIEIAGKPMVEFVAQALAASPYIDRIFAIGPAQELTNCTLPENTKILQGGQTIMETIQIGIKALGHDHKVLVATADIPLLTSEAIDDFLTQCEKTQADLYYPIVSKEVNDRRYPDTKRTYVRLKEGVFTGGNVFLVNPKIVPQCVRVAEQMIENRKNPLKLCQILGWSFLFKFVIGLLGLEQVEKRVATLLAVKGAVIQSRYPELGIDVDKPSDLEMVQTAFSLKM